VNTGQGSWNIQPLARGTPLGFDADRADTFQKLRKLVGDFNQFRLELLVLDALKDLVIAVKAAVEPVMCAPPKALAQFGIVPAPLAGSGEKPHPGA
jgi:hypothetical protein